MNYIDPVLYDSLVAWYDDPINLSRFAEIILGRKVSLRVYNWFVTNYAKSHDVKYLHIKNGIQRLVIVYHEYTMSCKKFHKNNFDPICRTYDSESNLELSVVYKGTPVIIKTNIAQLTFFKWAISLAIDQYIEKHLQDIKKDMQDFKIKVNTGKIKPKRGRTSVSEDSYSSIQTIDIKSIESFSN